MGVTPFPVQVGWGWPLLLQSVPKMLRLALSIGLLPFALWREEPSRQKGSCQIPSECSQKGTTGTLPNPWLPWLVGRVWEGQTRRRPRLPRPVVRWLFWESEHEQASASRLVPRESRWVLHRYTGSGQPRGLPAAASSTTPLRTVAWTATCRLHNRGDTHKTGWMGSLALPLEIPRAVLHVRWYRPSRDCG